MEKQVFVSPQGPPAVGPYSPAIGVGNLVFLSGQIGLDTEGNVVGSTPAEQARKALENMRAVLEEAGLGLSDVVKTSIFLQNIEDFAAVNAVYAEFFSEPYPARLTVQAGRLPLDLLVEMDAIAIRP